MMGAFGVEMGARFTIGACLIAFAALPSIAAGERISLAVFRDWGAFREGEENAPVHCFAIAEPPPETRAAGHGAFASVGSWPARRIRAQIAIHLSHAPRDGAPVTLSIGDMSFALTAKGRDAWAADRHADAAIVAAMRSGSSMSVSSVTPQGQPFADGYRLRGAASAIDSALLACPIRR